MRLFLRQWTVSRIGILLVIIGVSLMLFWGVLSQRDESTPHPPGFTDPPLLSSTVSPPVPTVTRELLVPTRTPMVVSETPSSILETGTPGLTPTRTPPPATSTPTLTPTSNIPSATSTEKPPAPEESDTFTPTPQTLESPQPTQTMVSDLPSDIFLIPKTDIYRLGVSLPHGAVRSYGLEALGVGWVMDWNTRLNPKIPPEIEFVQSVRMRFGYLGPDGPTLTSVAAKRPGSTWLIANEPDVIWQDNVTPETYARLYYEAYTAIKTGDPTAIVAAGGIAQPSALRLAYLDMILVAYQSLYGAPMPVQAWQIHNYMLREERGGWGIDIPPGISDNTGVMYGVEDSGNITAFKLQIFAFRQWMADRGYGGLPLIVSEYGIPMPPDYGFGPETVSVFFKDAWSFFYTATDPGIGNPADGGRLVQRWCWFSLGVESYPAGNLLSPPAGDWTPLADVWKRMVQP